MMTSMRTQLRFLVLSGGLLLSPALALSADNQPADQKSAAGDALTTITEDERTAAKAIFGAQCGWCHGNFGMTADKGPALAGTQMTEHEVQERIRNGKSGYMPSFRKFLDDDQIALMAKYVKSLKPEN
jgi:mono/diheme cytochrome c family protein